MCDQKCAECCEPDHLPLDSIFRLSEAGYTEASVLPACHPLAKNGRFTKIDDTGLTYTLVTNPGIPVPENITPRSKTQIDNRLR